MWGRLSVIWTGGVLYSIMQTTSIRRLWNFGAFARVMNAKVKHDSRTNQAVVSLPDISLDDIDRSGNLGIWRILEWGEHARTIVMHQLSNDGKSLLEYDRMTEDVFEFMGSSSTTVSKDLYSLISPSVTCLPQFDLRVHLGYVGTTSLNVVTTVMKRNSDVSLSENTIQITMVSPKTRRPTPIPDWWKTKYAGSAVSNKSLIVSTMDIPTNVATTRYDMKVRWDDIDFYGHTNYLNYVLFCLDAAADATTAGKYTAFSGDILQYKVKSIRSTYKNESTANDQLNIVSWECPENPRKLNFSVQKNDIVVYQQSVEFYKPDDADR